MKTGMRPDRRRILAGGAAAMVAPPAAASDYDARVGAGGYASVAEAVAAAPANAGRPWRILVGAGVWREKLTISKPWIHLIGAGRQAAELTFDAAAGLRDPQGAPWGTFRSATLTIAALDCRLANLRVSNGFDYPAARRQPGASPAGAGLQAVALALMDGADRTRVEDVDVVGWQDTLLANAGVADFRRCTIRGCVDFIFGAGAAWFGDCRIVSRARPEESRQGVIAAPSTPSRAPYGLVFESCRLVGEAGVTPRSVALARPWRPSRGVEDAVGQAVFLRCWMDDHIDVRPWERMAYGRGADGSPLWFEPERARFFEFRSRGPGAAADASRRQLSPAQARFFDRARVLGA